ncbi:MAG TPA: helix-turn-helix transcriptional regulator [Burkholderiaceae bacterium]|nr:helix-turn-helix transcriptional regulator [Burkholderiaceae bacterium]
MPKKRALSRVGPITPHLYAPSTERPLRAKFVRLSVDTEVIPHRHPWGQLAFSKVGVVRLTTTQGTYLAPPSRAVWIPPGVEHAVTVLEDADLRTLYVHAPRGRMLPLPAAEQAGWRDCRVLEVSDLLRALVLEMSTQPDGDALEPAQRQREKLLSALVLDELRRARPIPMGVDLPADKRLRALCQAVLDDPARHATLAEWARDSGASPRTVARLFRQELGTSFGQWRQRVLLAKALALAAGRQPMNRIAAELGYASASAFSAMVRRSVGQAPSRFFASEA